MQSQSDTMPDSTITKKIGNTNYTILEKTIITEYSRRILNELTAQNDITAPQENAEIAVQGSEPPNAYSAHTSQQSGVDDGVD